jgi:hypothetical protein
MSKYPSISVIDIAMGVLSNMDPKKDSVPPSVDGGAPIRESKKDPMVSDFVPDVSDTDVTDDYIQHILEGSMGVPAIPKKQKPQPVKETKKQPVAEEKISDLINRLSSLLSEAKQVLSEMNTTGMNGTNLSGKTNGSSKPNFRIKNRKR